METGTTSKLAEVWPAGPVIWTALSGVLAVGWALASCREGWRLGEWHAVVFLTWVLGTAAVGWFSLSLAFEGTGFPSQTQHAMLWASMTMGIAQLGIATIIWESMSETGLVRAVRATAALFGGIALGISLGYSAFLILEAMYSRGVTT